MKKVFAILFLILFVIVIQTNSIVKQNKGDNLSENLTADSLLIQADEVFQKRDYKTALEHYMKTAKQAKEEFNRSVESEALAQVARMNLILGNKDDGRIYLEKAAEKVSESDPYGWSRFLGVKGRFEWQDSNLKKSKQTFENMYDYCVVNSLWGRAVDAAHMVAIVTETSEEQIKWGHIGIEAAEANDQQKWLGPLWNNMAGTYYDMKQYDSTLVCYLKARDYHWQFSDEVAKLFADYHVGMTYRLLGKYDEACKWLRPVLAWAERIENYSAIGQACEDLGEAMIGLGKKVQGLKLLKKAREAYKKEGYDKSWTEIWKNINNRITENEG